MKLNLKQKMPARNFFMCQRDNYVLKIFITIAVSIVNTVLFAHSTTSAFLYTCLENFNHLLIDVPVNPDPNEFLLLLESYEAFVSFK